MSTDSMMQLREVEGFLGAGLFTPEGDMLASDSSGGLNLKAVGVLANNALKNAVKAAIEMGTGKAMCVHIEAEKGHVLALALNDGKNPFTTEPGKLHVHLVVALKSGCNLGMAKMMASHVIRPLAEEVLTAAKA